MREEGRKKPMGYRPRDAGERKTYYKNLFRKFVILSLIGSLAPLLLVGWIINLHYRDFAKKKMINSLESQVEDHKKIIELFLRERSFKLFLVAQTHTRENLSQPANIAHVFEVMNREWGCITDLGVIDQRGNHLAYVGPYDLLDKNYSQTLWFKEVMEKGIYISDMFMGFRKVPHFIIAVTRKENNENWILRATIDTEAFRSLVESVKIGQTGEVYLLNEEGIFQTIPRFGGKIMEKVPFDVGPYHEDTQIKQVKSTGSNEHGNTKPQIMAQTWLRNPRWMLVMRQDYDEAFSDVNHANSAILIFLHISAGAILVVAVLITRYMIRIIRKRDEEADQLNRQLQQTGKLAAIGELSAGVAHEINNPLAIILTQRQLLLDSLEQTTVIDSEFRTELVDSMKQIDTQVQRCKRITQNLLRFSRRTRSVIEQVDLNGFLREIVDLMEREARTSGVKFIVRLREGLPPISSDPSQLQQVFLNIINNALDAHDGKPYGTITVSTEPAEQGVQVTIADTGMGIPTQDLERIFDPFFTTKAPGKGTGLGLSICFSIVKQLGGDVHVSSELGTGTEFCLFFPFCMPDTGLAPHTDGNIFWAS